MSGEGIVSGVHELTCRLLCREVSKECDHECWCDALPENHPPAVFLDALRQFLGAGRELVEAWDGKMPDGSLWNADEAFGQPVDGSGALLLTHSLDEWLVELHGHYFP